MSENTPNESERESAAFRALVVAAFWHDDCEDAELKEVDVEDAVPLHEDDVRALEALGHDLVDRIVSGEVLAADDCTTPNTSNRRHLVAMNRGTEVSELSDEARAEMERKIQETKEQPPKERGT